MDLMDALRDVESQLRVRRDKVAALQAEIEKLESEYSGLRHAAERYGLLDAHVREASSTNGHDWKSMTRTDAVVHMLVEINRPVGPTDLSSSLRATGRDNDSPTYVSAALSHLLKQGRVKTAVGQRGRWTHVDYVGPSENAEAGVLLDGGGSEGQRPEVHRSGEMVQPVGFLQGFGPPA